MQVLRSWKCFSFENLNREKKVDSGIHSLLNKTSSFLLSGLLFLPCPRTDVHKERAIGGTWGKEWRLHYKITSNCINSNSSCCSSGSTYISAAVREPLQHSPRKREQPLRPHQEQQRQCVPRELYAMHPAAAATEQPLFIDSANRRQQQRWRRRKVHDVAQEHRGWRVQRFAEQNTLNILAYGQRHAVG